MNITVIVPTKRNEALVDSVVRQLGSDDEIITFEQPTYASRKMDVAIKSSKRDIVLIINPKTVILSDTFIQEVKANVTTNSIYLRAWDNDISQGFVKCQLKNLEVNDCVWFVREMYKGVLKDFSSHLEFNTILKTIIRPFYSNIYCPTIRVSAEFKKELIAQKEQFLLNAKKEEEKTKQIVEARKVFEKQRKMSLDEFRKSLKRQESERPKPSEPTSTNFHNVEHPMVHLSPISSRMFRNTDNVTIREIILDED